MTDQQTENRVMVQQFAELLERHPDATVILATGIAEDKGIHVKFSLRNIDLFTAEAACVDILASVCDMAEKDSKPMPDADKAILRRIRRALGFMEDHTPGRTLITPEQRLASYAKSITCHLHADGVLHVQLLDDDLYPGGNMILSPADAKEFARDILSKYELAGRADPVGVPEGRA